VWNILAGLQTSIGNDNVEPVTHEEGSIDSIDWQAVHAAPAEKVQSLFLNEDDFTRQQKKIPVGLQPDLAD
jgi:hypothetical protein